MQLAHSFLLSALLLVSGATPIVAVTDTTTSTAPKTRTETITTRQQSIQDANQVRQEAVQKFKSNMEESKAQRQAIKQERTEFTCQQSEERITRRMQSYDQNHDAYQQRYQSIYDRITNLISKLNARGCDTSQLRADLATINSLRDQAATQYATFISALQTTSTYVCGQSEGDYKAQVQASRGYLLAFREKIIELHQFIRTDLRFHLNQINTTCQTEVLP